MSFNAHFLTFILVFSNYEELTGIWFTYHLLVYFQEAHITQQKYFKYWLFQLCVLDRADLDFLKMSSKSVTQLR